MKRERSYFSYYGFIVLFCITAIASVKPASVNETGLHNLEGKKARLRSFRYVKRDSYTDAAASAVGSLINSGTSGSSGYPEDSYNPSQSGGYQSSDYSSNNHVHYSPPSSYGVSSGGYGPPMKAEASSVKYHYKIVPQKENNGWEMDSYEDYEDEKDGKKKGLLGLLGLTGLTGLIGLKPLKLLGALALPLAPVLLPIVLLFGGLLLAAPLIIGLLLILFVPIPSVFFPPGSLNPTNGVLVVGRSQLTNATALNETTSRAVDFSSASALRGIFRAISTEYSKTTEATLASTECLERASCEMAKFSRSYNPTIVSAILRSIRKMFGGGENGNRFMQKIDLGLSKFGHKCYQFRCDSFPTWTKAIKSKIS